MWATDLRAATSYQADQLVCGDRCVHTHTYISPTWDIQNDVIRCDQQVYSSLCQRTSGFARNRENQHQPYSDHT